jgi:hypothetical protein
MRRGLMAWDAQELPRAALEDRLSRLRARMGEEKLDAFIVYTNIARGAGVCWLTGFTPYWNEGLVLVPAQGAPLFATALSKRVAEWIASVMPQGEVVTTPKPPALIAEQLAKSGAVRVGVLELDGFPAGHAQTILAGAPGVELIDATAAFAAARAGMDSAERGLTLRADALARESLASLAAEAALDPLALVAACEQGARLGGAEECFITLAPDLGKPGGFLRADRPHAFGSAFALRVSVAYKGVWSRSARSFAKEPAAQAAFAQAEAAFARLALGAGETLAGALARVFAGCGQVKDWSAEQPRGSYPLAAVASADGAAEGFDPASPFVLNVELEVAGLRWRAARLLAPGG